MTGLSSRAAMGSMLSKTRALGTTLSSRTPPVVMPSATSRLPCRKHADDASTTSTLQQRPEASSQMQHSVVPADSSGGSRSTTQPAATRRTDGHKERLVVVVHGRARQNATRCCGRHWTARDETLHGIPEEVRLVAEPEGARACLDAASTCPCPRMHEEGPSEPQRAAYMASMTAGSPICSAQRST
jgi:hypothetical protein